MNEDDIEELVSVVKERKERTKSKYKINRDGVKGIIIEMIGNFKSVYQISHWLGKIQSPQPFRSKKGNSKFETLLAKLFSLETKNKIKHLQLQKKKSNFYFPRKQSMVPLDKEFQWVNVKQKPFNKTKAIRHIQP